MSNIIYKKGDLFLDPELKNRVIVHACNSQGVWGRGFAKTCKEKYPNLSEMYTKVCKPDSAGQAFVFDDDGQKMACLITSKDWKNPDYTHEILTNTLGSLEQLSTLKTTGNKFISPKFNSGLFKVPWELTEPILKTFVEKHDWDWVVYEPENK